MPKPTNKDFDRLATETFDKLQTLTRQLANGDLTPDEWGDAFHALLVDSHADAWLLGSRRGGRDVSELQQIANRYGQHYADTETQWLNNFIDDLANGRYTDDAGNLKLSAIDARSRLYVGKLRGNANQAFVDSGTHNESYRWVMTGFEHCEDCPRLAALSPFTANELYTVPGAGDTECLGHCRCVLVRESDGVRGFTNPF